MIALIVFCFYALIAFVVAGHLTEDDDDDHALGIIVAVSWPISLPLIVLVARWIRDRDLKAGDALRERISAIPRETLTLGRRADNDDIDPPEEAA